MERQPFRPLMTPEIAHECLDNYNDIRDTLEPVGIYLPKIRTVYSAGTLVYSPHASVIS